MKVRECMSENVSTIKPDATVTDCAKLMGKWHVGCIPVCDNNNKIVGIVTDRDILLRNVACSKDASTTKVSEIMTTNVQCCDVDDNIEDAQQIMIDEQIRRIPVIDNGKIVGILTLGDLAVNENVYIEDLCDTIEGICGCNKKNAE